jgi:hypothetical protein
MALYPYQNVHNLYTLATKTPPFTGLSAQPNDWTIGVSYTSSNYALSIATTPYSVTSATIDIDASGKIWFPTNLSNATGVANFDPTAAAFNGPYLTGYYTQPQYVAIDSNGYVWATDVASGDIGYTDTAAPDGINSYVAPIVGSGILGPIGADATNDVFFSVVDPIGTLLGSIQGTTTPVAYAGLGEPPTGLVATTDYVYTSSSSLGQPCTLIYADTSSAAATQNATDSACNSGGVAFASGAVDVLGMATSLDQFCLLIAEGCGGPPSDLAAAVNLPEGIATDGLGNEWIANSGNASVFTFGGYFSSDNGYSYNSPVAYLHDTNNGNTMTTPYAIAIDGSGNVWIANAGCVSAATASATCTPGAFVLSEIIGAAGPTITPLSAQMVGDGFLSGHLPGTTLPPFSSAHPHSSAGPASNRLVPNASSNPTGKPLVWRR